MLSHLAQEGIYSELVEPVGIVDHHRISGAIAKGRETFRIPRIEATLALIPSSAKLARLVAQAGIADLAGAAPIRHDRLMPGLLHPAQEHICTRGYRHAATARSGRSRYSRAPPASKPAGRARRRRSSGGRQPRSFQGAEQVGLIRHDSGPLHRRSPFVTLRRYKASAGEIPPALLRYAVSGRRCPVPLDIGAGTIARAPDRYSWYNRPVSGDRRARRTAPLIFAGDPAPPRRACRRSPRQPRSSCQPRRSPRQSRRSFRQSGGHPPVAAILAPVTAVAIPIIARSVARGLSLRVRGGQGSRWRHTGHRQAKLPQRGEESFSYADSPQGPMPAFNRQGAVAFITGRCQRRGNCVSGSTGVRPRRSSNAPPAGRRKPLCP
ncbi:unnamed protein product [Acanthosepion pharaonis]|uniref:Uncharacterized protein n=1 Tax=Acanthosepion pharaonis TaxID=158019 RepID=A0A812DER8_ACAPH|nr:unnamed protein product [Sepia pharaonis]